MPQQKVFEIKANLLAGPVTNRSERDSELW